jgi:hypothetical protein
MKRLKFKSPFNGKDIAIGLIPESYKVNNKVFEMTDGNESYTVRWEGDAKGNAVVLKEANQMFINEDMLKIKHLMNYSSKETLGTVTGKARVEENTVFVDTMNKAKLLSEGQTITKKAEEPASEKIVDAASEMKPKDGENFTTTKHKGLPEKVKESKESVNQPFTKKVKWGDFKKGMLTDSPCKDTK